MWDKKTQRLENPLLKYQSVFYGMTLPEAIVESTKARYRLTTKSDQVDTEDCILLSCSQPDPPNPAAANMKVWVVPSKGYCIKKYQNIVNNEVTYEYIMTLKEYAPGIWWFDSVRVMYSGKIVPDGGFVSTVSTNSVSVNKPIDPTVFTLAGTNIPYGTHVIDEIAGLNYIYGHGYRISQQDVDLVLDAIKNTTTATTQQATEAAVLANEDSKLETAAKDQSRRSKLAQSANAKRLYQGVQIAAIAAFALAGLSILALIQRSIKRRHEK